VRRDLGTSCQQAVTAVPGPDASYHDLGHGYYQARSDSRHREGDLIRRLERLTGQTVTPQARRGSGASSLTSPRT
jgi:hypothetical protein